MPPKQPVKVTTGLRPKSTKATENGKESNKTPKEEGDNREQILERENMMLRKNLDMTEIMKVFHQTVPENHMQAMFFETLHDLELKIQKYESSTGLTTRGSLSDLQIDLDRERANTKSLDKQVKEKNRMIDDYRKSLTDKDKELKAFGTELELQRSHNRHASEALEKHRILQLEYDELKNLMIAKESTIMSLSREVENLKNELVKAEKLNATLKSEAAEIEKLREEVNGYSKEQEESITEIKDLTRKLKQRDMMFKENEALLHEQQKILDERNKVIESLNAENKNNPVENEEMKKELSELRNTLDEQTKNFQSLKEDNQRLLDEKNEKKNELAKITEILHQKENIIEELESRLDSQTNSRIKVDPPRIDQTDELNRLTNELKEAKAINAKVTREKEKLEFTCHEAFDKLEKTEKRIKQHQEEHNKAIKRKDEIIQKLRAEKLMVDPTGGGNANIETKSLVEKYEKTVKELASARNEIEDLKQRLLKLPGGSLVNGTHSITDLNADNRPAKLSEKFSELYENEWTVAYKEAAKEFNSDEKIIGHLYKTVMDIFDFCKTIADEHEKSIQACALTVPYAAKGRIKADKIGISNLRQLKELRKLVAPHLVEGVFKHFLDTMQINLMGKRTTEKFMKKCVEICWLMNSHDPPVTLDATYSKGAEFDGDRFRSYTKSGKVIDYVVWPPVLLHKDGQLLCKGVAQAR